MIGQASRATSAQVQRRGNPGLPVPTTWFTRLKQLSDTRYYQEVLEECGTFQSWIILSSLEKKQP